MALDIYGGYTALPVPGGATGHFRTGKLGSRWVLATPLGNAFWMTGVYFVTGSSSIDELGASYDQRVAIKYPNTLTWATQCNRRLLSWGFNTLGEGTYAVLLPTNGSQTVKMPFVGLAPNPGITGWDVGAGSFKMLYTGLDTTVSSVFSDSQPGHFPDVYDPAWNTNTVALFAADSNLATFKTSAYFIGMFGDDTDYLNGFGPGVDFPTDPTGKYHWHLGYLSLVMAPTQATNVHAVGTPAYTTTEVFTKTALKNFLTTRYGTIGALNTAWGSSYSTFSSSGGWPTGSGFMDENGRTTHTYLGTAYNDPFALTGMNATVKADLNLFLYELSKKFFTVERDAFKAVAPDKLFLGPTNLGGAGWRCPTRGPTLQAAGEILDVATLSTDGSQAQLDFIGTSLGDHPFTIWEGTTANPDSGRFRYTMEAAGWVLSTQAARGALYAADVNHLLTRTLRCVGLSWWSWADSYGEQANWGLVSLLDNAYDGVEARIASGTDPWGYTTGGEEANYGNFLGPAITAHATVEPTLAASLLTGARRHPGAVIAGAVL